MTAYYNEIDQFCCGVLRRRTQDGSLPHGHIDERPIQLVQPSELSRYRQLHLFAGIGGFGLAAKLAGLPDDFSILTGGFPCQPFSVSGKRRGDRDDRYLWPDMLRIIRGVRPPWVLGENVPGLDDKNMVLDRVLTDLEDSGYEGRAFEIPACSVNAPILRRRIWIVARAISSGLEVGEGVGSDNGEERTTSKRGRDHVGGAHIDERPRQRIPGEQGEENPYPHWAGARPFYCADGKTRRIPRPQSGIQLVASGIPERVARLTAAGNAICPQVAAEIMKSIMMAEEP